MVLSKFKTLILVTLLTISMICAVHNPAQATPGITITAPVQGQTYTGNNFTISGTSDTNATIQILKDQKVLQQVISDSSGRWSAELTDLPDGNNNITARVTKNPDYAYFIGTADLSSFTISQLRLSDNAINPNAGWPKSTPNLLLGLVPSPGGDIFYGFGGSFDPSVLPSKFVASSPGAAVPVTGAYPSNPGAHFGDYSADGSKYYSPNLANNKVSVIDTQTNAWVKDIIIVGSTNNISVTRSPNNNKLYVSSDKIYIINPATDTVETTVSNVCSSLVSIIGHSQDPTHEYYYVPCINEGQIKKYRISDNSLVASWNVGGNPTGMVLSGDNSKLFMYSTSVNPSNTQTDIVKVINTSTGVVERNIQLTAGAFGMLSTPDFQKLYLPTPGTDTDVHNIDVVSMIDYSVQHISLGNEIAAVVTSAPARSENVANISVGVVLGVKTSSLSDTGVISISTTLLLGVLLASITYTFVDYRRHRKPLMAIDPDARHSYTYLHHVKTVSLPMLQYRLQVSYQKNPVKSDYISRF